MDMLQKLVSGGPVMLVLLAVSITACALVIFKTIHFWRLGLRKTLDAESVIHSIAKDGVKTTSQSLSQSANPYSSLSLQIIELCQEQGLSDEERLRGMELAVSQQIKEMEVGLRAVSVIAHLSPLLGLLGTVLGMVTSFRALEQAGMRADPAMLAGGIWEALLTTAFGLTIAIPLLAAFHYFEARVDRSADRLEVLGNALVRALKPRASAKSAVGLDSSESGLERAVA